MRLVTRLCVSNFWLFCCCCCCCFQFQQKKKIGFYKLSFRCFYYNSFPRISHSDSQHSNPDSPHFHPYYLHSYPHSPHFPHSVRRFPIVPFTDSRDGLVVKALDSQFRGSVYETTGRLQGQLSLSSFRGQ